MVKVIIIEFFLIIDFNVNYLYKNEITPTLFSLECVSTVIKFDTLTSEVTLFLFKISSENVTVSLD